MKNDTKTYEGMFLVDAGRSDFDAASEPIRNILDRSSAEILSIKPWDERKLAYPIRGRKRGLYVLTYFRVDPNSASEIERHCQLSEDILRVLILRRDEVTEEQMDAKSPAELVAARRARSPRAVAEKEKPKPDTPDAPPAEPPKETQPKAQKDDASGSEDAAEGPADASVQPET